jgi:hypothetical protein
MVRREARLVSSLIRERKDWLCNRCIVGLLERTSDGPRGHSPACRGAAKLLDDAVVRILCARSTYFLSSSL